MMTCPSCGRKTAEGAFCTRCGAKLGAVAPSEPPMTEAKAVRAIEEQVKVVETRIAQETSDARLSPRRQGEPTLEVAAGIRGTFSLRKSDDGKSLWLDYKPNGMGLLFR